METKVFAGGDLILEEILSCEFSCNKPHFGLQYELRRHKRRKEHFGRSEVKARFKLYFVDSFAAALALEHKATLVTSDSDFPQGLPAPFQCFG